MENLTMNQIENQLQEERKRADGYKRGLQNLMRDFFPLLVCMILLGCILGSCLSVWIFFGIGG